ncbi:hypothetical protein F2Q68_00003419 [Brassica cretica]|uniref:Uncharacterized protein n=1 Tax=Brassica cretica TaxID=69181 RepID=A0A8S9JG74_BRACR|nr:hypothetical protein F2Q68_00003419 [Brassica cretica]
METTTGAHRGAGDSSSPQDSSAVTEPTAQPDAPISATTDHPRITSVQLAAMTISDHLANTLTLVATTSGEPSMVATSDHLANTSTLVATTSDDPSMVATSDHLANTSTLVATTSDKPSMVATSDHPANTSTLVVTTSSQPSMVTTSALPANNTASMVATSALRAAVTTLRHLACTKSLISTTSGEPSMVATSDHLANTSTLVVTTSGEPSMVATSDHLANTSKTTPVVTPAATQPPNTRTMYSTQPDISMIFQTLLGRIDELARGTTSRLDDLAHSHISCNNRINELQTTPVVTPAATQPPNTRTMYSTQPDISMIFQTLLGRIDELARGTTSRLDDLVHSQIACNNRINELQSVEIGASRSHQVDITPRLQRVLFNDLPTPMTGSGQQRSIQANDLRAPITSSGQQHQNHVNESSAPIIDSRQQHPNSIMTKRTEMERAEKHPIIKSATNHPVAPQESTLATVKDQKMHRHIAVL